MVFRNRLFCIILFFVTSCNFSQKDISLDQKNADLEIHKISNEINKDTQYSVTKSELDFLLSEGSITKSEYEELSKLL